jgi:sugar phosphate isomerase/epimerase
MKIVLATHTLQGYPPKLGGTPNPDRRLALFNWARRTGFDGLEIADWWFDFPNEDTGELQRITKEMAERDLELTGFNCLRRCITHPSVAEQNRKDLIQIIEVAKVIRPKVVSVSYSIEPSVTKTKKDWVKGVKDPPGGSRSAKEKDFEEVAAFSRQLAENASTEGIGVALELHHGSITDSSKNLLKVLDIADHPNLSANPDLGNLYWAYDEPLEPWYEAVENLVGRVELWHVKNVQRVSIPEVGRSAFVHSALNEGDIDYRWALSKFVEGGFDGYLSIEGAGPGDLLGFAARSKAYLDGLLDDLKGETGLDVYK